MSILSTLVLFSLLSLALAFWTEDLKDLSTLDSLDLLKLGRDVLQVHPYEALPSDVQFYLLTKSNPEAIHITNQTMKLLDPTKKTKIIIHGWLENHKRSYFKNIGEKFLENDDPNFVEVDWAAARMPYDYSAKIVRLIGNQVAQFIEKNNLSPKDVHIIGHSLGAHVAGFAGKKVREDTGEKIQRISALDPAGPYFSYTGPSERLDKGDANIVDAIHTDAGFCGYKDPIGTLDIYVNGGTRTQPGCLDAPSSIEDMMEKSGSFCSHTRSTKYFTEWINGKFTCTFCQSPLSTNINLYGDRCIFHQASQVLGCHDITESKVGICFTETNKEKPYLS